MLREENDDELGRPIVCPFGDQGVARTKAKKSVTLAAANGEGKRCSLNFFDVDVIADEGHRVGFRPAEPYIEHMTTVFNLQLETRSDTNEGNRFSGGRRECVTSANATCGRRKTQTYVGIREEARARKQRMRRWAHWPQRQATKMFKGQNRRKRRRGEARYASAILDNPANQNERNTR